MTASATPSPSLVLGSTSIYRRELLERLRIPFSVQAPDVDETPLSDEAPGALAARLALAKACAVAKHAPSAIVIGSDQVADLAGKPLGKPLTHARAVQQLQAMRGQTVLFHTAVAVVHLDTGFQALDTAVVRVRFRDLSDIEIENYLQAEQPYDCAGSAKSEGLGIALLDAIDSDRIAFDPHQRHAARGWAEPLRCATPRKRKSGMTGTLYLVPAPLDFGCSTQADLQLSVPLGTLETAAGLSHWVCENAKSARAYLKRIGGSHPLCVPIQAMQLQELPREVHKKGDHTGNFDARPLLQPALDGHDMGLLSEAGMPAVADPGSSVVRAAHELGIAVVPLTGPVSVLLALAASGLNGQNFAFVGYVPAEPQERVLRLKELETLALKSGQTQLFIETPYRNVALLQSLLQSLHPNTRLATSSGLTLPSAQCFSGIVKEWKKQGWSLDNQTPTVFGIGR